MQVGITKGGRG